MKRRELFKLAGVFLATAILPIATKSADGADPIAWTKPCAPFTWALGMEIADSSIKVDLYDFYMSMAGDLGETTDRAMFT